MTICPANAELFLEPIGTIKKDGGGNGMNKRIVISFQESLREVLKSSMTTVPPNKDYYSFQEAN